MEWLKYEWQIVCCAWVELRKDMDWTVRFFIKTGIEFAVLLILLWWALGDTEFREEVGLIGVGVAAAAATPLILFVFHWLRAPYNLHKAMELERSKENLKANSRIESLENTVRIYETPRDAIEKMPIEEALNLLPKERRLELFRSGAYQNRFDVFGKKMKTETRFGRDGERDIQILNFDTGDILERDLGWPYFENNVLVIDGPRDGERVGKGLIQPYTAKFDATHGSCYTNLTVGKIKFQIYAESCAKEI